MRHLKRRRAGFTLWEMLTVIILLSAVGMLMPRLFRSTLRIYSDAPAARDEIVRYESMLQTLRADVWDAREITVTDASARIALGTGELPEWTIDHLVDEVRVDEVRVARNVNHEQRSWRFSSARRIRFSSRPDGIILSIASDGGASDEIIMHSELQMLNRGRGNQ